MFLVKENVSISSPVWRLFLESKCSSASVFFKLHISARSYFHSPTPWSDPRSTSNLSRKVSGLMDLHRPGATSYSPFDNKGELGDTESAPAPAPAPAPESVPVEGEEAPPVE